MVTILLLLDHPPKAALDKNAALQETNTETLGRPAGGRLSNYESK
jgi:hypothetical protein